MDIRSITQKLFEIVEPVAGDSGLEVVDIDLVMENAGWVLRIYLDGPGGVNLAACEAMSRELSATFDVSDPIPCAYSLEVSSAGIDRPLRTREHFERFRGETAKVRLTDGLDGRKNWTGVISDVRAEGVAIDPGGGATLLPFADIQSARLVPNWDELLGGGVKKTAKQTRAK